MNKYVNNSAHSKQMSLVGGSLNTLFGVAWLCITLSSHINHKYSVYISNQKQPSCKKRCGPHKGHGEKRCEIQGGGQEMAVMVG